MKKKKWLIPTIVGIILLVGASIILYNILTDASKLSSSERNWINTNINNVQNINVIKDENIFSKDGKGVFYTFLNSFSEDYGIKVNPISFEESSNVSGIKLDYTHNLTANSEVFLTDHYVLLSKDKKHFLDYNDLNNITINALNSDLSYLEGYLKDLTITFNGVDTLTDLLNSDGYIILPRIKYLDSILENDYEIVYHFSDINNYYVLEGANDTLSSILEKYFIKFNQDIKENVKKEELAIFTNALKISPSDIDKLLSINYNYGFINNSPYEVIMSGNYGGIIAKYLQEFSEFSGVYFNITKYSNEKKLSKAINNGKIDIYFEFNNNLNTNYLQTSEGITNSLVVLARKDSSKLINSLYGLQNEDVYVLKDSNLQKYVETIPNVHIHPYTNLKELFKLNKEDIIIVMDKYLYEYYHPLKLNNYVSRYETYLTDTYKFRIKNNYEVLNTLLSKYLNYLDESEIVNAGLNSHEETIKSGNVLNNVAKYFIIGIALILLVGLVVYRKSKKIRIARRVKKNDKIRFIDELTCLKNRAYLSDFMKTWSNNTIYPQTIIVVDLNHLKEINDKFGVTEGDRQIQAAANALIKTQLDNSDLMRSDGNEFVIYTVGYTQKQIINYIHKLNKELKKLPYNYGAEFGYSFINNNLKTIEDALQEATMDMKSKKKAEE